MSWLWDAICALGAMTLLLTAVVIGLLIREVFRA